MSQNFSSIQQDLQHPDVSTRSRAIFALDAFGDTQEVLDELLAALANEKDLLLREDITWTLVKRKTQSLQPLIEYLKSENPLVRHNAAHTLGKIADAGAVPALLPLLQDSHAFVVSKVAFTLRQIGDETAIPALVALLGHENREVQTMLIDVLEHFGTAALNDLASAMQSEKWQVREHAADVLGHIPASESIELLAQALKDEVWQVRFAALTALSYHGAKTLIQSLQDDPHERVSALARSLGAKR